MNHIYKTVWNAAMGTWTAVQETAKSHGKSSGGCGNKGTVSFGMHFVYSAVAMAVMMLFSGQSFAATVADGTGTNSIIINSAGTPATAAGANAVAVGVGAQAATENSIAIGNTAAATTDSGSIAIGATTKAFGKSSVALGTNSESSAQSTVAIGSTAKAKGNNAVAVGDQAESTSSGTVSLGQAAGRVTGTRAGNNSVFIGVTAGDQSNNNEGQIAIGWRAAQRSQGAHNIASGFEAGQYINGTGNVAMGYKAGQGAATPGTGQPAPALKNLNHTVAVGTSATVGADNTVAIGRDAKALAGNTISIGQNAGSTAGATPATDAIFVGTGAGQDSDNNRLSIAIGRGAGKKVGDGAAEPSTENTAIGNDAGQGVKGNTNVAISSRAGQNVEGHDNFAALLEAGQNIKGRNNIAIGKQAGRSADAAVPLEVSDTLALGAHTVVSKNSVVALGTHSNADRAALTPNAATSNAATVASNQVYALTQATAADKQAISATVKGNLGAVSVGNATNTRQIINVAAGSEDSDAVNVAQLKAVANQINQAAGTHYYSVKDQAGDAASANSNYNNDGATGDRSLAAGIHSKATGTNATAVGGKHAKATAVQALALGADTLASGNSSIAIGGDDLDHLKQSSLDYYNTLTGDTITVGQYQDTTASADGAIAVGVQTQATGDLSTAVGVKSAASGLASVALGVGAQADKESAVALGAGSTTASNATQETTATVGGITYSGFAGAAQVTPGHQVSVGKAGAERQIKHVAPGAINAASTDAINGSQLHATQTAIGNLASSTARNFGGGAAVQPDGSISAPTYTINGATYNDVGAALQAAARSGGGGGGAGTHYYSINSGDRAAGSNYNNDGAAGVDALAAGVRTSAAGRNGVAVGSDANASGNESLAVGNNVVASDLGATAVGNNSEATAQGAQAFGQSSVASGVNSAAVGRLAKATGDRASAFGVGNTASGASSFAGGDRSNAALADSIAIGKEAKTTGTGSGAVAIGRNAHADGQGSTSMGINARSANQSIAIGTNANNPFGTAGAIGNSSVAIGNNTNAAGENTVALGNQSTATGSKATALGFDTKAQGQSSVVIGDSARNERNTGNASQPHADQVVAVGVSSNVNSLGGIAIGSTTKTTGVYGTAIGIGSQNNADFGVALGALSTTDNGIQVDRAGYVPVASAQAAIEATKANAAGVSVGGRVLSQQGSAPGQTAVRPNGVNDGDIIRRQIHNVAAGTDDTDAVNVAQLKAVADKTATTPLTVANGKVTAPAAGSPDAGKLATAGDIANAINSSGFTLTVQGEPSTASLVNPGETVDLSNGDGNIVITKGSGDNNVSFSLADTVKIGPAANPITINGRAGTISGLGGTLPATTSVAPNPTTVQAVPALTPAQSSNAATVGDVLNAGWNLQGNNTAKDFVRAYDTVNFVNGNGTTVTVDSDGATSTIKVDVNAQGLAESAQLPVVYTKADGSKVYKHSDGNFYDAPNGGGTQVPTGDVIASMQNADGTTTAPTTLANVKAGKKDTDAVNVSQLKGVADALGGGAAIDPNTGAFTAPSYVINKTDGSSYPVANNVGQALQNLNAEVIKPLTFAGDSGTNVQRTLGSTVNVKGGATGTLTENNIGVEANGTDTLTVKLAKDIDLGSTGSVKTGNTTVNNSGVTIAGGANGPVSLTNAGLNNGGNQITNVASGGDVGTNAANIDDVKRLAKLADTSASVSAGSSAVTVTPSAPVNGVTNYAVDLSDATKASLAKANNSVQDIKSIDPNLLVSKNGKNITLDFKDDPKFGKTTVGNVVTDGATNKITGLNNGVLNPASKDAVNGSQLYAVGNSTAAALGGTSAFDPVTGQVTAGLSVGGATHSSVQAALNAINTTAGAGWNLQANGGAASHVAPNGTVNVIDGSNTKVTLTGTTLKVDVVDNPTFSGPVTANGGLAVGSNLTVAPGTNVDMGNNIIHNVADGVSDTDAVNLRQVRALAGNSNAAIGNLNNRINANHDKAMGGIASAMASAGLPQAYLPGKSMIAMGVGAYQGRSAVAVGVSTISDNGRWIIKGSVNASNKGHVGATLGAGYQW